MISTSLPQPSVASLTERIHVLAECKQQWEADTTDALEPIQALRDYATVLRTTLSQVEAAASLLENNFALRMKVLFDEPMHKLRKEITAMRDEDERGSSPTSSANSSGGPSAARSSHTSGPNPFSGPTIASSSHPSEAMREYYQRMLKEDIIPSTPEFLVVVERVPPLCALLETYAVLNSEKMRLPPDVMEGIIPMIRRWHLDPWSFGKETPPSDVPLQQLHKYCELAQRQDYAYAYQGTLLIRKLLSVESDPSITAVRESGVVPHLVNHLSRTEHSDLQFEAAWALMNWSESKEDTHYVMGLNFVKYSLARNIALLESADENVREQASWAIGNVAGDSVQCRDRLLEMGVMGPLLRCVDRAATRISLKRNAVSAVSKLCRSKPPPAIKYTSQAVPVMATQVIQDTDDQIVTDALWTLSYSTAGGQQAVQMVLDQGILPRVVSMLTSTVSAMHLPALRIIGNFSCTFSDTQTQAAIDAGALPAFHFLLRSPNRAILKEAAWALSNVTAGDETQIQAVLDADLLSVVMDLFDSPDQEIKKEAVWVVVNASNGGTPKQLRRIVVDDRLFYRFEESGMLKSSCAKILAIALECIQNCLHAGSLMGDNPIVQEVIDSGCVDIIECLQAHTDQSVRNAASDITERYS